MHRVSWLSELTSSGEAIFVGRERFPITSVVYCTGYKYSFPFLEDSKLVKTGTLLPGCSSLFSRLALQHSASIPLELVGVDKIVLSADDGHVHPTYKHIFVPDAPTLCFIGLLWKSLRFPQFELQVLPTCCIIHGAANRYICCSLAPEAG
jgi:hypothetical protein